MSAVEERVIESGLDEGFRFIRVDEISVVSNFREAFDEEALSELAADIKEHGVLQPLLVRPISGQYGTVYALVAGERRLRASKIAGLATVPCTVRNLDAETAERMQLTENLHRRDLSPIEEAKALQHFVAERGYTQAQCAAAFGKKQPWVSGRLGLLDLPELVKKGITRGIVNASAAEILARYTKAAPDVVVKVVEKMKDKPIPVAKIRDEVDLMVANKCNRLDDKYGWAKPAFDPAPCIAKCPKVLYLREYGSKEESPRCPDKACWEAKNKAAKDADLQRAMEVAGPNSIPYEVVSSTTYRRIYEDDGVSCPIDCEHRRRTVKPGYGEGPEEIEVCLRRDCYDKQDNDLRKAKQRAEADARKARIKEYVDAYRATNHPAHLGILPHSLLVSLGLPILLDMRPMQGTELTKFKQRMGWTGSLDNWELRGSNLVELVRALDNMPVYQLIDLLMETIIRRRVDSKEFALLDYLVGKPLPEPQPVDVVLDPAEEADDEDPDDDLSDEPVDEDEDDQDETDDDIGDTDDWDVPAPKHIEPRKLAENAPDTTELLSLVVSAANEQVNVNEPEGCTRDTRLREDLRMDDWDIENFAENSGRKVGLVVDKAKGLKWVTLGDVVDYLAARLRKDGDAA